MTVMTIPDFDPLDPPGDETHEQWCGPKFNTHEGDPDAVEVRLWDGYAEGGVLIASFTLGDGGQWHADHSDVDYMRDDAVSERTWDSPREALDFAREWMTRTP